MSVTIEELKKTLANVPRTTEIGTYIQQKLQELDHKNQALTSEQCRIRDNQQIDFVNALGLGLQNAHDRPRLQRSVIETEMPLNLLLLMREWLFVHGKPMTLDDAKTCIRKTLSQGKGTTDTSLVAQDIDDMGQWLWEECQRCCKMALNTSNREHKFMAYKIKPLEASAKVQWLVMEMEELGCRLCKESKSTQSCLYPPLIFTFDSS